MMRKSHFSIQNCLPTATPSVIPSPWKNPFTFATFALGCLISSTLVFQFGVNVFFWDEWDLYLFFQALHEKEPLLPTLWQLHNEHRLVWVRLIFYALSKLPAFDLRYVMLLGQILMWATIFPIASMFGGKKNRMIIFHILLAIIFLSPIHQTNQLWAFQIQWYCLWFGLVYCTYFLTRSKLTWQRVILAIVSAGIAYLSTAAGLFVIFNGLILLGLRQIEEKNHAKRLSIWAFVCLGTSLAYFAGYEKTDPGSIVTILANPIKFIVYALSLLGNLIGTKYIPVSAGIGGLGILYTGYFFLKKKFQQQLFAFGLIQFGLMFMLAVTMGRLAMGIQHSLSSHYTLLTMSFWIGILLLAQSYKKNLIFLSGFGLLLVITAHKSWGELQKSYSNRLRGAYCYHQVLNPSGPINPEVLPYRDCKFLFPDRHLVIKRVLQFRQLGITLPP
ncbi:MAG: hypothetical protein HQM14_02100 [SAR324 cluster bacterium]|nr:hypothetical protein [SAR324 cluster bacterium]